MMNDYNVSIVSKGRDGNVVYQEGTTSATFFWEFGADRILAMIDIGSPEEWEAKTKFDLARRDQIIERIADQVMKQKAPGCTHTIVRNWLYIEEKPKNK